MKIRLAGFLKQVNNRVSNWYFRRNAISLLSSPLSPSQKQYETNPSREQKNAAVFANRSSWRKITTTSLTEVTAVSTTDLHHERKKSLLLMLQKTFCVQARFARPEKPCQSC